MERVVSNWLLYVVNSRVVHIHSRSHGGRSGAWWSGRRNAEGRENVLAPELDLRRTSFHHRPTRHSLENRIPFPFVVRSVLGRFVRRLRGDCPGFILVSSVSRDTIIPGSSKPSRVDVTRVFNCARIFFGCFKGHLCCHRALIYLLVWFFLS